MSAGDDATLPDTSRGDLSPSVRSSRVDLGDRYELGDVLGRGGMGEVRLARDVRIQREVAVKLLRGTQPDDQTLGRFFREARIQGVLDHPSVVPVHDLGIDAAGNPYFVMKRLAGVTLAEVLASKDPAVRARWPRRQLLTRLIDVCLAIELAHTRGVIHRDLKPANIMLGDFGEAYVLDWGLARLASDPESIRTTSRVSLDEIGQTAAGDLLGTPGYMSPEQARGDAVDARADVYALGCVLFEVLANTPAMPRGIEGISAALSATEHRPSTKASDIPPELDELCARATAADRAKRLTARQLADGIQAYLDGDRDVEARRELAMVHAKAARDTLDTLDTLDDASRATGMREAGRALALDPSNELAQQVLGRLLLFTPDAIPAEALVAADAERSRTRKKTARWAAYGFFGLFLLSLVMFAMPVRAIWPVVVATTMTASIWLLTVHISRKTLPMRSPWFVALLVLAMALLTVSGLLFGPLLIMPIFTVGAVAGFISQPTGYRPTSVIVAIAAPQAVLVVLELVGVLPPSFGFRDGELVLRAWLFELTPSTAMLTIGAAILIQIINTAFVTITARRAQELAQNRVHALTWHMKQLVPKASVEGLDVSVVERK